MGHKKTMKSKGKKHLKRSFTEDEIKETKKAAKSENKKLVEDQTNRKKELDSRSLFIKFNSKILPKEHSEIMALHPDIKQVITPRTVSKKDELNAGAYSFALVVFTTEDEAVKAKKQIQVKKFNESELFVDFCGEKSKSKKEDKKSQNSQTVNPCRLYVSGFKDKVNKTLLATLFPKCSSSWVKKNAFFGFVNFPNPELTKDAFDAAQDLDIGGNKITVMYAKQTDIKVDVIQKKRIKIADKNAKKKADIAAQKVARKIARNIPADKDSDDESEPPAKKTKGEDGSDDENDEDSGEDDNESGEDDDSEDDE